MCDGTDRPLGSAPRNSRVNLTVATRLPARSSWMPCRHVLRPEPVAFDEGVFVAAQANGAYASRGRSLQGIAGTGMG